MSSLHRRSWYRVVLVLALGLSLSCQLDQLFQPSHPAGIVVDPPALADSAPQGSTANRTQTLAITGDDPNGSWHASIAAGSDWIQLARVEDTVPSNVSVVLKPAGLTMGAHEDTIILKGAADRDPVRVPVTFMVTAPAPPATGPHLVFSVEPTTTVARASITPAVRVEAQDASGNRVQSFAGSITLALGTNPASGKLSGTTTLAATGGAVVFTNLSIDQPGTGYTLTANATGMTPASSAAFNVTAATSPRLNFVVPPSSVQVGGIITPAVVITALDADGHTALLFTGTVTLTLGSNPGGGTLGGTGTTSAQAGVAIFTDLSIDRPGNGYRLVASADGYTSAQSRTFNVTAASPSATRSTVTVSPESITASDGSNFATITVSARDAAGNALAGVPVSLSAGGAGSSLSPASGTTDASGVVTSQFSSTSAGNQTITATVGDVTIDPSASVTVVAGSATALAFTVQPSDVNEGETISPPVQVSALDAFGNLANSYFGDVTLSIESGGRDSGLRGTTTLPASAGVATFGDLSIENANGGGNRLQASAPGLASAVSENFRVDN